MSEEQHAPRQRGRGLQLDRYVVSVDGQRKIGFLDRSEADAAAYRLRHAFPVLTVIVSDQEEELIRERTEPVR